MKRSAEEIRDISVEVYKIRLNDDCPETRDSKGNIIGKGNVQRMLEKDAEKNPNDNGKKLRGRAGHLDQIVRATLQVMGLEDRGPHGKT